MNEALNRDQQIELMKNVKERHDALFRRVLSDPLVREVASQPAPSQVKSAYVRTESRLACYG